MENGERKEFEKYWSRPKRMLRAYVDSLAIFENGATKDVIREGIEELWPNVLLTARVVNADPIFADPEHYPDQVSYGEYPVYALVVHDGSGNEIESIEIDGTTGSVIAADETGTPYFDYDVETPDFMIESFIVRYHLNEFGTIDAMLDANI